MNRVLAGFMFIVFIVVVAFGFVNFNGEVNASSINPQGQCGEGPTGTILYADFSKVVGEMGGYPYTVDVCKYYNVGGLTLTPEEFCYLPEVINGWYRIYRAKNNLNGDYVCWIDWNIEGHWNAPEPTISFRGFN